MACAGLLGGLGWLVWRGVNAWQHGSLAAAPRPVSQQSPPVIPRAPADSATSLAADRTPDPGGRGQVALAALARLVRARGVAFERADPSALGDVYVADSGPWQADRTRVNRLRDLGVRYDGVRYAIREASAEPSSDISRLRVRARIDTLPYTVVHRDGRRTFAPGSAGTPSWVTLRSVGGDAADAGGWRIDAVGAR